jgi:hypothetical protein
MLSQIIVKLHTQAVSIRKLRNSLQLDKTKRRQDRRHKETENEALAALKRRRHPGQKTRNFQKG